MKADTRLAAALQLREEGGAQGHGAHAAVGVASFDDHVQRISAVYTDGGARRQGNAQGHGDDRRRLILSRQITDSHVHQALAAFLQHQVLKDEAAWQGSARRLLASGRPVFEDLAVLGSGLQGPDRRHGSDHR